MIRPKEVLIDGIAYVIPEAMCEQCGYLWMLRGNKPRSCPKCRSNRWTVKGVLTKKEVLCRIYKWLGSMDIDYLISVKLSRKEVLERDQYVCVACGENYAKVRTNNWSHREQSNLDVHHIDGDVANNLGINQVSLCKVCHGIIRDKTKKED